MLKIAKEGSHYRVELFQVNKLNTLFSELVKHQLRELVDQPGVSVIFNLEGIRFIDSSGFDVLIEVSERAGRSGSRFTLCNISSDVKELIVLLDLEDRFDIISRQQPKEKILLVLD